MLPAENISTARSSISTSAIFARLSAAALSTAVQVGERNMSVSEMMAAQSRPAIFFGISTPFS